MISLELQLQSVKMEIQWLLEHQIMVLIIIHPLMGTDMLESIYLLIRHGFNYDKILMESQQVINLDGVLNCLLMETF